MKNTFKYLIATVAFSAAALTSGLNLNAQNLPADVYLEEDGICFRKTATQNEDGSSYNIDLEAFVKGAVHYTESADPSDIVLVLDVSGSMETNSISSYEYSEASTPTNVTWKNRDNNLESDNNQRYIKYGDDYYRVRVARYEYWYNRYYYYLFFQVGNTQYYIHTNGVIDTDMPTNVTSNSTNLLPSSVQLYSRTTISSKTRLQALKEASVAFIREVAKNAEFDKRGNKRETPLDHKISIVKFAQNYYNDNSDAYEEVDGGNHFSYSSNCTEVVRGLKSALSDSVSLINAVNNLSINGNYGQTSADYGMHLAKNIIDHIPSDRVSNKTVVFFTDGEPYRSNYNNVGNDAISNSHDIKLITYTRTVTVDGVETTEESHPQVFSVGVFTTSPEQGDDIYTFMDRISSNYPDATSMTNSCTKESSDFYKDASGGAADLNAIFKAIAGAASSQESNINSSSAVTVDVVTSSFSVPSNAEEAELEVLVAPCIGSRSITYNGETKVYLIFGDPVAPEDAGADFVGVTITPTIDATKNTVSTTGFDFAKFFCGVDDSGETPIYRGWKQVIRFKINLKDDAVGGPAVATNDESSGIYVNGEQLATFNRPRVKIPVQIWIQKQGLEEEESAVLTLYATPYVEGQAAEVYRDKDYKSKWTSFTKVIINSENMVEVDDPNNPGQKVKVVKLVGLDPDYYYRLKEDAWAFGYVYQTSDGVVDTIGDDIINPITLVNKRDDLVFDEAVVRNVFSEKTE